MRILLTYCLLLFGTFAAAQPFNGSVKIENITFPAGNQLAYVIDIAQDSTGLIWMRPDWNFYTYNGHELSKVNREVMGFRPPDTRRLHAVATDRYFYMARDSLIIFDPIAKKVVKEISQGLEHFSSTHGPPVFANIGIGENEVLWATVSLGSDKANSLVVRSQGRKGFEVVDSMPIKWYYNVTLERDGHYFIKLRDRVEEVDSNGLYKTYYFPSGPDPVMTSMVKDDQNTIWVVQSPDKSKDQYVVYSLEDGADEFVRIPEDRSFPQEEKHGQLFVTGEFVWHRGYPFRLSRLNVTNGTIEDFTDKIIEQSHNFPFYNSTLLKVFRDQSGEFWITTRAGIVKMTIEEDLFQSYDLQQLGLDCEGEDCLIRGITEDKEGNIYLSHINGIVMVNPKTGIKNALSLNMPPQTQKVHALSFAKGILFWNEYAIDLKTFKSQKLFESGNYEYLVHTLDLKSDNLWIGLNDFPHRLYHYDLVNNTLTNIPFSEKTFLGLNDEIRQMHFSPNTGTLFLSIWNGGLLEIDTKGKILKRYTAHAFKEGWIHNTMYGLYEDEDAQLWFGHGSDAGLSKLDLNTREITTIPYKVNSYTGKLKRVFRILPGERDQLWLVTEKGMVLLNKANREITRFPMFPSMSEMAFHLLPGFAADNGTLYIGTPSGSLNAFDPDNLYEKAGFDQVYPIVIDRFERFNKNQDSLFIQLNDLNSLSEIRLTHRDRYFNLEFFVPDYRDTDQNLYTYWLEGYDKNWSPPFRINQLQYENLPPGEYTLHIRGGLTPDYYKSSERVVNIFVAHAWYVTWWAYTIYAVLVLGLFSLFYRYQIKRQIERSEAQRIKELDSLKSRLYTNITHEFRTPLTVIIGMVNNIRGHSQEKQLIQRNSTNLLQLINQLLDLSKLDSGAMKIDLVQSDMINYLKYLTESFYSMAEEKKVRLTFYSEVPKLIMDFDEVKIQHITYNLLTNAIKFTDEGGKVVLHASQVEHKRQAYLRLKAQDTGIGIQENQLNHIFDRFYQADHSSTRKGEGTGIGLALTKDLVELMDGSIAVESEFGKGTTFTLLLPIRQGVNTPILDNDYETLSGLAPGLTSDLSSAGAAPLTSETLDVFLEEKPILLVIEDNIDVITYIESILKRNFQIETAANGQQGIDKAFELVPDIIISDVMMPEKDGYEVCQSLKNDERTSHIPIILLTAKASSEDRIEGLKGGADAYLIKPFNKEELLIRLEKLIGLRKVLQVGYSRPSILAKQAKKKATITLDERFMQKLIKVVHDHLDDEDLGVVHLCRAAGLSNSQVNRKLKALTGKTPSQFIHSLRLQKALELLQTTNLHVSEIAYSLGFKDPNYFTRIFSEEFGCPPNAIRK